MTAVFAALQDAETGFRGFLVTNDTAFLEPFYKGKKSYAEQYDSLKGYINENKPLQGQLDTLQFLLQKNSRLWMLPCASTREQAI